MGFISTNSAEDMSHNDVNKGGDLKYGYLTLILESWKKNPKRGTITEGVLRKKIQSAALRRFVYVSVLWIFFPDNTLGHGPKKWHIFLFSAAYFLSYWHMPFEISIIIKPN